MTSHFEHKCPQCDYTSRTEGRLKRHIKDFHSEDPASNPKVSCRPKIYKCKQCDFQTAIKVDFWDHSKAHIKSEKMLQCPRCPFVTEYKHHLEYHLRNHFGSKPFKCEKCNYSCVNKSMLNSHMKSHTNVYQYRCSDCHYATKYCHSLKLHLKKYDHKPATVLNPDGSLPTDGSGDFELVSKRGPPRGPRTTGRSSANGIHHQSPYPPPQQNNQQQHHQQQPTQQPPQTPTSLSLPPPPTPTTVHQQQPVTSKPIPTSLPLPVLPPSALGLPPSYWGLLGAAASPFQPPPPLVPAVSLVQQSLPTGSILGSSSPKRFVAVDLAAQIESESDSKKKETPPLKLESISPPNSRPTSPLDLSKSPSLPPLATPTGARKRKGKAYKLDTQVLNAHPQESEVVASPKRKSVKQECPKEGEGVADENIEDWDTKFECAHCAITFIDCILYTMHMGYHSQNEPFKCNMCGQIAANKVEFNLHIARASHV
ncbi:unnamed protein product [Dimorphilus gyrociliatus]|nr:unnamed protein product [Dimorphilus gyrociliatus]